VSLIFTSPKLQACKTFHKQFITPRNLRQALGYKLQILTSHSPLETPMSHPKKVKIRKRDAQKYHTCQQGAYVSPHRFATSFQWCYICSSTYYQPLKYMHFVIECQHLHTTQLMKEPKQNSSKNTKNWSSHFFLLMKISHTLTFFTLLLFLTFWPQQLSGYTPMNRTFKNVSLTLIIAQR